jgi:hypothetical protein
MSDIQYIAVGKESSAILSAVAQAGFELMESTLRFRMGRRIRLQGYV